MWIINVNTLFVPAGLRVLLKQTQFERQVLYHRVKITPSLPTIKYIFMVYFNLQVQSAHVTSTWLVTSLTNLWWSDWPGPTGLFFSCPWEAWKLLLCMRNAKQQLYKRKTTFVLPPPPIKGTWTWHISALQRLIALSRIHVVFLCELFQKRSQIL